MKAINCEFLEKYWKSFGYEKKNITIKTNIFEGKSNNAPIF